MSTALLVIDTQMAFVTRRAAGSPWANPQAAERIATLLSAFRAEGLPVLHVHHHGSDPRDEFHASAPGAAVQPEAAPLPGEPVFVKHHSSAFIGTGLQDHLQAEGISGLAIVGGAANFCVETTTRMASDLGYSVSVVEDALINFGKTLRDGRRLSAEEVLAVVLATLDGEFAYITTTSEILTQIAA